VIAALFSRAWAWIALIGGAAVSLLAWGRHREGRGRDDARQEARTEALETDKEATDAATEADRRVTHASDADLRRLRSKWTRRPR